MKNKLLIIGASGHGKVVADIALKMGKWKQINFLDDNENIDSSLGLQVIGKLNEIQKYLNEYEIFVGIGNNSIRKEIQEKLQKKGVNLPVLIHPSAIIGNQVIISPGTVVMAGVVVNSCTSIGKGCVINTGSTIDHDNLINDYVHISPGVHTAGTVSIGEGTWLGIGSIISNNIKIAENSIVGAGSVVINDVPPYSTVVGIPAKIIKIHN